jgi:hypothetical protein
MTKEVAQSLACAELILRGRASTAASSILAAMSPVGDPGPSAILAQLLQKHLAAGGQLAGQAGRKVLEHLCEAELRDLGLARLQQDVACPVGLIPAVISLTTTEGIRIQLAFTGWRRQAAASTSDPFDGSTRLRLRALKQLGFRVFGLSEENIAKASRASGDVVEALRLAKQAAK